MKYLIIIVFAVTSLVACPAVKQEAPAAAPEAAPEISIEGDTAAEIEAAPEAQAVETDSMEE